MHADSQGRLGRPITTGETPSTDKEKELLGQAGPMPRTLSASRFQEDGRLSPLPSSSSLPWMNGGNGIRCLSLSPAPSSRISLMGPPGYAAATAEKNEGIRGRVAALKIRLLSAWGRNEGPILVCLSQFFAALMSAVTRLLELDEETGPMHPMMILFWRMSATTLFSGLWTYYSQERSRRSGHSRDSWQDAVLGIRAVRSLLLLRSLAGFMGLYGLWYSMIYLPLAEAVVISFLAPTLAGYLCHVLMHDRFTRREQLASFLALAGVVLIARPISLLAAGTAMDDPSAMGVGVATAVDWSAAEGVLLGVGGSNNTSVTVGGGKPAVGTKPASADRLTAILSALIGVLGGALTIVTLRKIGTRAHTLISVNYFSVGCVVVTTAALALGPVLDLDQPLMRFAPPASWRQAGLLVLISVCGFSTQFLMTSGIAVASSSPASDIDDDDGEEEGEEMTRRQKKKGKATGAYRATAMIYTNMLFSAGFDRWLFGEHMSWVTIVGCALIVGSALWVIVTKDSDDKEPGRRTGRPHMREYEVDAAAEEGVVLLESMDCNETTRGNRVTRE